MSKRKYEKPETEDQKEDILISESTPAEPDIETKIEKFVEEVPKKKQIETEILGPFVFCSKCGKRIALGKEPYQVIAGGRHLCKTCFVV